MKRNLVIVAVVNVLALISSVAGDPTHMLYLYDIRGMFIGSVGNPGSVTSIQALATFHPITVMRNGIALNIATGFYYAIPSELDTTSVRLLLQEKFGFKDVTSLYLPSQRWDAADIATADISGDGKTDMVFSLSRVHCDSVADRRPRVWIQTDEGQFVDETESRIPLGRYAADQIILFDCDGDGDTDIFLTGWGCEGGFPPASLLINNGAGVFTDESARCLPPSHFIYSAAVGRIDDNTSPDLVVIDWTSVETIDSTHQLHHPLLWLNDGNGVFTRDTLGRFQESNYGYFIPVITDVDNDSYNDVAFADMEMCITGGGPSCIDTLRGQTALYMNSGDGFLKDESATRIPSEPGSSAFKLAAADIDQDGDADLFQVAYQTTFASSHCTLLLNDGTGHFSAAPGALPVNITGWFNDVSIGTLNSDQFPDVFLARVLPGQASYDVLLVNNGNGSFSDSSTLLPSHMDFSTAAVLFDHEKDGDQDIIIANAGVQPDSAGQNVLYHNTLHVTVAVNDRTADAPATFWLLQSFPNPCNPSTTIRYGLPHKSVVQMTVHNMLGQQVATLVQGEHEAGDHEVRFDASELASGVYFCRLRAGDFVQTKKLVIMK